jgi:peptidoglycan hydrolase-like protein with peptidoglycan-binding domain
MQIALKDFGFNPGTIDGKFGPKTKGALDDFKKLAKISENNIGRKTIEKIIENIGASKDKRII